MIGARSMVAARIVGGFLATALVGGVALACTAVVSDGDYKVGSACGVASNDGKCALCLETSCCAEFSACLDDTKCTALDKCVGDCANGDTTCVSDCGNQYGSPAVTKLTAYLDCGSKSCSICALAGIGDACMVDSDCASKSCLGRWCSASCTHDSECTGKLSRGHNVAGQPNFCVTNLNNVNRCFPGCSTDDDCKAFAMTTCKSTDSTDGAFAHVCSTSSAADGGT